MLIQPNRLELGDLRLNPTESLAKIKEDNLKLFGKHKLPGQDMLENVEMSMGRPLEWKEFVRKLNHLGPKLFIHDGGAPNAIAIHVWMDKGDGEGSRWCYVGGFEKKVLPEFSHIRIDEHELPVEETRGWRSVLMGLVRQDVITHKEVVAIFGDAQGQRSVRWHEQLQDKKN